MASRGAANGGVTIRLRDSPWKFDVAEAELSTTTVGDVKARIAADLSVAPASLLLSASTYEAMLPDDATLASTGYFAACTTTVLSSFFDDDERQAIRDMYRAPNPYDLSRYHQLRSGAFGGAYLRLPPTDAAAREEAPPAPLAGGAVAGGAGAVPARVDSICVWAPKTSCVGPCTSECLRARLTCTVTVVDRYRRVRHPDADSAEASRCRHHVISPFTPSFRIDGVSADAVVLKFLSKQDSEDREDMETFVLRLMRRPGPPYALQLLSVHAEEDPRNFLLMDSEGGGKRKPRQLCYVTSALSDSLEYSIDRTFALKKRETDSTVPQAYTEGLVRNIFRKLMFSVREMHDKGVIHRDIATKNVMIRAVDSDGLTADSTEVVMIDFGLARTHAVTGSRFGEVGTLGYLAPECVRVRVRVLAVAPSIFLSLTRPPFRLPSPTHS